MSQESFFHIYAEKWTFFPFNLCSTQRKPISFLAHFCIVDNILQQELKNVLSYFFSRMTHFLLPFPSIWWKMWIEGSWREKLQGT